MCTVTFLPINKDEFILTSNRDVPYVREKALKPKKYIEDGITLTYPKDGKAGGTWIGLSSKNRLLCLLNGGYVSHVSKTSYRLSRGEIVKNLLKSEDIENAILKIRLLDIEAFTLIIVDWNEKLNLIELVWDGEKKHIKVLPLEANIWSSSTIYDSTTKKLRQEWFKEWNRNQQKYSQESIIKFHKTAGNGNLSQNVLMKRKGGGTVSITSIIKKRDNIKMSYEDLSISNSSSI